MPGNTELFVILVPWLYINIAGHLDRRPGRHLLHSADVCGGGENGGSDEDTYVEDRSGGLSCPVKCQQRE